MWCEGPKKEHEVYHIADGIITFIEKHTDDSEMLSQPFKMSHLWFSSKLTMHYILFGTKKRSRASMSKEPIFHDKNLN